MITRIGITWRLSLVVLAGAGLVMGSMIVYGYFHARQMLEREMEATANNLTRSTAYRIDTVTKAVEMTVQGLAAAAEEDCLTGETSESLWRLLEKAVQGTDEVYGSCFARTPDFSSSGTLNGAPYVSRQGGGFAREDLGAVKDYHYWVQDWFVLPRELDRPVWTEPYFDEGGGNTLMVTCSAPVREHGGKGTFKGVVTCDVSLVSLTDTVSSLSVAKSGYAFLLSRNGAFICHPSSELVLKENIFSWAETLQDASLRELGRRMIRGESGFVPHTSLLTAEPGWMVFVPVPTTRWTLGVVFPEEVLTQQVRLLSRIESQIAVGGFAALFLIILLIARSITKPIEQLDQAARTLAAGNLDAPLPRIRGRDEIAELGEAFATMRDELKTYISRLAETVAAKERIQSELRIAHDIQMSLVPKTFPPFPTRHDLDLYAIMNPAREVGGDFYDFFLTDESHLCLAIADVAGKGMPAALFMAVTRSFLRSIFREEPSPARTLARLNAELSADNPSCMFATLFCAVLHLPTGECRFANGGHNRPMIVSPDGTASMLPTVKGAPIGAMEESTFGEGSFSLQHGQTLFLYTDGVTEAMNPQLQMFGEQRMAAVLQVAARESCTQLLERVEAAVHQFVEGAEQSDDLTMLALRRN